MIFQGLFGGVLNGLFSGVFPFPPPPAGFAYLVDNDGAFLRDNNGSFLITRI